MTEPDTADPDDGTGGPTSTHASITPPDDGFAEHITAEFTSRRHIRGATDRWISARQRVLGRDTYGLDRDGDGVGCE